MKTKDHVLLSKALKQHRADADKGAPSVNDGTGALKKTPLSKKPTLGKTL